MTENEEIKKVINGLNFLKEKLYNGIYADRLDCIDYAISALKEIQQYREIGTVEECRKAVEKQKGMQVNEIHVDEYFCPACGSENSCGYGKVHDKYCPICGHAIYQEGSEEE